LADSWGIRFSEAEIDANLSLKIVSFETEYGIIVSIKEKCKDDDKPALPR